MTERSSAGKWIGGSVNGVPGIDCGGFVTTLLNESGFDPDYNYGGVIAKGATAINSGQLKYIKEHPDQWKMVNPSYGQAISNESDLSPGDVAFNYCNSQWRCEHTFVYVGEIKGFGSHIASASYGDGVSYGRAPMAGQEPIVSNGVTWYHKVK